MDWKRLIQPLTRLCSETAWWLARILHTGYALASLHTLTVSWSEDDVGTLFVPSSASTRAVVLRANQRS